MSSITDEERERALETGTFEGVSLDEGYYVPVSIEMAPAGAFRVVFSDSHEPRHHRIDRVKLPSDIGGSLFTRR